MKGTLYGVGVGPGDSELLTLKAVRTIQRCDVLAVPGLVREETVAYRIVEPEIPEIKEKDCLCLHFPMTKDKDVLKESHERAAKQVMTVLESGKSVAFLTLGDPTIYSTYLYVHRLVKQAGYEVQLINGIPSFCAVSAALNDGLVEQAQQLHIVPSSYGIEEALKLPGTKILMKAGRKMAEVKQLLADSHAQVYMVENCGMADEKRYYGVEQIPSQASYYSLLIVKG